LKEWPQDRWRCFCWSYILYVLWTRKPCVLCSVDQKMCFVNHTL
jgi:hypothetical protein